MSTPTTDAMASDFVLPYDLEAHEPPEARGLARDGVRLLVSRGGAAETRRSTEGTHGRARDVRETRGRGGEIGHRTFADLPGLLEPGDLLVVNNSATLPAAVRLDRLAVHFSTEREDGTWLVELRRRRETASEPYPGGAGGEWLPLPGGATLRLLERETPRLWRARLDREVPAYLHRYGVPIRYSYVDEDWPLADYQTVFGVRPGSAEMPSAGRPFTTGLVTELVSRGIGMAPITLHTGVASPEKNEPPYPEWFEVPETTARQVELARESGSRVIAVGTTVVRALETAALATGHVRAAHGWTSHIVTPSAGVRAVNGLITGFHEPRSSHLLMLSAIAGGELLSRSYAEALGESYLWHEFGDVHLILS